MVGFFWPLVLKFGSILGLFWTKFGPLAKSRSGNPVLCCAYGFFIAVLLVQDARPGKHSLSYAVVLVLRKSLFALLFICIFLCRAPHDWSGLFSELKPLFSVNSV